MTEGPGNKAVLYGVAVIAMLILMGFYSDESAKESRARAADRALPPATLPSDAPPAVKKAEEAPPAARTPRPADLSRIPAGTRVLVIALSEGRAAFVAGSLREAYPKAGRYELTAVIVEPDSPGAVAAYLRRAAAAGVRYVGLDGGAWENRDAAVGAALRRLNRSGVRVVGTEFAD